MLGLTNDGQLRYGPGIDMQFDDFNTSQSNLWVKLKEMFGNEIAERYMYLRSNGIFSYDKVMEFFEGEIINKIGETFYNEDQRIKYVNENNSAWIYMSNGSRLEHMKRWISERLVYLDSVYEYGTWQNSAIIRSNVPDGEYTLNFKTASPQWIQVSFSDQAEGKKKFFCDKDQWYSVTGRIQNAVDNNMPIKGIDGVMYIDGIEFLNVSSLLLGSARQLCELSIPDNKRIIQLEVGKNTMLQKLNCKNCALLGSNPNYKSINLTECVALKYIDLSNTQIGEVALNENGGSLEYFDLSGSKVTILDCNKQEFLDAIYMDNCADLATVRIRDCNALYNLSITNTKLESLTIQNCAKITNLDISNNGHITELSLRGCENLKSLNAANLTNTKMTELDLRDSISLETLNIRGSFNIHNIRLNENLTTLSSIIVTESGIQSLQFGNEDKPSYLDLGRFPAMSNVSFQNCTSLKEIRNMNLELDNANYTFQGCKELKSITGKLTVKGDMRQTFTNCTKLTILPEMDLSKVKYMYHSFDTCQSLKWSNVQTIFASLGDACETIDNVFSGAQITGGKFESSLLSKLTNVKTLQYPFRGIKMSGQVPADFFANNTQLKTVTSVLEGASGTIPDDLFANNEELTTVTWLFGYVASNTGITQGPTSRLFRNNAKITSLYGCFYGLLNAVFTLDDQFFANLPMLSTTQEMFYNCLKLEGSIPANLFANNKELTTIQSMFARDIGDSENSYINNLSGSIPGTLFKNNQRLTTVRNAFGNCDRLTGDIPMDLLSYIPNVTDIASLFANCKGLTGAIKTDFWRDCTKIRKADGVFQGTGIGKQDGTATDIPEDFFSNKPMLETVAGMFSGCENINFTLHPFMFQDCVRLGDVSSLFQGCTYFDGQLDENIFTILNKTADKVYYKINTETMKRIITETPITKATYDALEDTEKAKYIEDYVEIDSPILNASSMFDNCNRMRGMIPDGIFRNLVNTTNLGGVFQRCTSLTGPIPDDLFKKCKAVTSIRAIFAYCTGLSKNSAELTDVNPYFVAEDIFVNNLSLTDVGWAFAYMTNLEGQIPGGLFRNNTFINNIDYLFYNNGELKGEIPNTLFSRMQLLENMAFAFNNCKKLTAISATLLTIAKNPRVSNMQSTFNGCSALTGVAPSVWNIYPGATKANCFTGCTNLSNYASIPTTWK